MADSSAFEQMLVVPGDEHEHAALLYGHLAGVGTSAVTTFERLEGPQG